MADPKDIRLIVFDIDGVLTDGSILVGDDGMELRRFHVRDGLGIKLAQQAGLEVGVISGRATRAATLRLSYLGIRHVLQGEKDKGTALRKLCGALHIEVGQAAFLGDDLIDLPALLGCGYPMAVGDAVAEVKAAAQWVTPSPGGRGAVREAVEHLLKAQGKWEQVVQALRSPGVG